MAEGWSPRAAAASRLENSAWAWSRAGRGWRPSRRPARNCWARDADLSASRAQQFLAGLREGRHPLPALDHAQAEFSKREAAAALGLQPSAIPSLVRRHRLAATGKGKARRYPRATVE